MVNFQVEIQDSRKVNYEDTSVVGRSNRALRQNSAKHSRHAKENNMSPML